MKDIKSLYLTAKSSGKQPDVDAYTECIKDYLENKPYDYISNLEYIISSNIGLKTLREFVQTHGISVANYNEIVQLLEHNLEKCKRLEKDYSLYEEALSYIQNFKESYPNIFMMYEAFEEKVTPEYIKHFYERKNPLIGSVDTLYSRLGNVVIPDILIESIETDRLETLLGIFERSNMDPAFYQWIIECSQDFSESMRMVPATAAAYHTFTTANKIRNDKEKKDDSEQKEKKKRDKKWWAKKESTEEFNELRGLPLETITCVYCKSAKAVKGTKYCTPCSKHMGESEEVHTALSNLNDARANALKTRELYGKKAPELKKAERTVKHAEKLHRDAVKATKDVSKDMTVNDDGEPMPTDTAELENEDMFPQQDKPLTNEHDMEPLQSREEHNHHESFTHILDMIYDKSLDGIVERVQTKSQQAFRESVLLGTEEIKVEYTDIELKAMEDLISFKEYQLCCLEDADEIMNLQNEIYSLYEEFDGLVEEPNEILESASSFLAAGGNKKVPNNKSKLFKSADKLHTFLRKSLSAVSVPTEYLAKDSKVKKVESIYKGELKTLTEDVKKKLLDAIKTEKSKDKIFDCIDEAFKKDKGGFNAWIEKDLAEHIDRMLAQGAIVTRKLFSKRGSLLYIYFKELPIILAVLFLRGVEKAGMKINAKNSDLRIGWGVFDMPDDGDECTFIAVLEMKGKTFKKFEPDLKTESVEIEIMEEHLEYVVDEEYEYLLMTEGKNPQKDAIRKIMSNFRKVIREVARKVNRGIKAKFKEHNEGLDFLKKAIIPSVSVNPDAFLDGRKKIEKRIEDLGKGSDPFFGGLAILIRVSVPKRITTAKINESFELARKFAKELLEDMIEDGSITFDSKEGYDKNQLGIPVWVSKKLLLDGVDTDNIFESVEELEEVVAHSIIPMLPGATMGGTMNKAHAVGEDGFGNYRKTGDNPPYIKTKHDMAKYGEDDTVPPDSDDAGDEENITLNDFKRPSSAEPVEDEENLSNEELKDVLEDDVKKAKTPEEKQQAVTNLYYYNYKIDNQGGTVNTTSDHSQHKRVNSDDNYKDPYKEESVGQFKLNPLSSFLDESIISSDTLYRNREDYLSESNDTETDPGYDPNDESPPESDHPVRDRLMDIDRKLTKTQQAAKKKVQDAQNVVRVFTKPAKRTSSWINAMINRWKDKDENKLKEKMADPHHRGGLFKAIRAAVVGGSLFKAGLLWNPIFLFLAITKKVSNRNKSFRLRNEMIGEIKTELEIIDTKIRHAEQSGDRKAVYQLMRFKNELNKKLLRVGFSHRPTQKRVAKMI